jgi:predicted ribonuclease YlaK
VDCAEVLNAPQVTLVLAPVVLSELDKQKWSGGRREKSRAKAVLKLIDELALSEDPVLLRPGVELMAVAYEPASDTFARHRLEPDTADDRLLASLLELREGSGPEEPVLLVSADGALRVKARTRQIPMIAPTQDLVLPDEPDEIERELAAANRELAAFRTAAPLLRLTIEGESFIESEIRFVKAFSPS